jgi:hypothetical protein
MMRQHRVGIEAISGLLFLFCLSGCQGKPAISNFKGPGIYATSVLADGFVHSKEPSAVRLLTKEKYDAIDQDKDGSQKLWSVKARGNTPIFLGPLKKGIYYIGVEARADFGFKDDDVAYDGFDTLEFGFDGQGNTCCRKWYWVNIDSDFVYPMGATFLPKGASLDEWEKSYPVRYQFVIDTPPESILKFYSIIREYLPGLPDAKCKQIVRMLREGGRVPISNSKQVGAFRVTSGGGLEAIVHVKG